MNLRGQKNSENIIIEKNFFYKNVLESSLELISEKKNFRFRTLRKIFFNIELKGAKKQ